MSVVNLVMLENRPTFNCWVSKSIVKLKREILISKLVLDYYSQNAGYQGFQHYSGSSIISSAARSRTNNPGSM